jgi:oligopeptide transport system substrate-binding protein
VVHLRTPTAYVPALLTNAYLIPIYEPAVKQWGDSWTQPGHMVSNGPFSLSERVINGHITLQKNPYYWDAAKVRLSKVVYSVVSDYAATTDQYLSGNIDFTDRFNVSEKERLQRILGNQMVISPIFASAMFGYNLTKPPFQGNPKLRLALNVALDREILMNYVQHGVGVPAYNMMPPLTGYDPAVPDWAKLSPDARHDLARKLYQEAGYSDTHPLEVVLTYASGGPDQRRFMEALAAMWQMNLGAKVQIYNEEWKVFLQARQLKQPTFYWDAWSGDFPDPFTFMQLFQTGFGMNDGDYRNPQFDALVGQASSINDAAARSALFHKAEAILNEDAPLLPVYYYVSTHLIKPYVKGWQSNVTDRHLSRYMYVLAHQES